MAIAACLGHRDDDGDWRHQWQLENLMLLKYRSAVTSQELFRFASSPWLRFIAQRNWLTACRVSRVSSSAEKESNKLLQHPVCIGILSTAFYVWG